MRVGQIKSVAVKLFEDINELCKKEKAEYKNSQLYSSDLARFIEQNEDCRRITEAYQLLNVSPEYVTSIQVKKERVTRWDNYYNVDRDTNLMEKYEDIFDRNVTYEYSYKAPESVEAMYYLLEYQTITATNLIEVEDTVLKSLHRPEGFKVIIN